MKSRLAIAALAAGLAAALPAAAQQPGPPPGWTPPAPMAGPQGQTPPMMGMSGMQGGPMMGPGPNMGRHDMDMRPAGARGRWAEVTQEQREAFMALRIANIKAALRLTPEQEKLWPPVEAAMRESVAAMAERVKQRQSQERPADPIAAMRLGAESMAARASMMQRMADAAAPLYASLNDQQKAQVPRIFRRMRHDGGGAMRMMRDGWDGPAMGPGGWGPRHDHRWWNHN